MGTVGASQTATSVSSCSDSVDALATGAVRGEPSAALRSERRTGRTEAGPKDHHLSGHHQPLSVGTVHDRHSRDIHEQVPVGLLPVRALDHHHSHLCSAHCLLPLSFHCLSFWSVEKRLHQAESRTKKCSLFLLLMCNTSTMCGELWPQKKTQMLPKFFIFDFVVAVFLPVTLVYSCLVIFHHWNILINRSHMVDFTQLSEQQRCDCWLYKN